MTVKEKLSSFVENGISISFIAHKMGVDPSTLSKWLRGEKGITHKNEDKVLETLQQLVKDYQIFLEG